MLADSSAAPAVVAGEPVSEIVVTGRRREQSAITHAGNVELLGGTLIDDVAHQHIHQLMTRVAGVWVSRGSGQEHLTAIRSPVLTGAGSCGAFLFLENGIPIRPAGFCNVNQLFEIDTEQARSIEVIRGPGNALYGSNALHGIINVLMPAGGDRASGHAVLEVGSNRFLGVQAELPMTFGLEVITAAMRTKDFGALIRYVSVGEKFSFNEAGNLAASPGHAEILADMRARLRAWMERTDDPLLHGPVPAPKGAKVNPPDQLSPQEEVFLCAAQALVQE